MARPARIAAAEKVTRPQARTAATRRRILEAATAVFGARGFNNGSLIEIAEQAGMTHAGVLHHFGSKDNLLTAVLEFRDETDVAHLERHRPPAGKDLFGHLLRTVRLNVSRPGIVQTYAVLSAESVTEDHPAQSFFRERFTELRRMIADSFGEVAPEGCPDEKLLQAASATIAVMDGLQVQWLLDDSVDMPPSVEAVIKGLIAWLNGRADDAVPGL